MDTFAITLGITGLWFVYAGVTNHAPIKTITAILQDPGNARNIIRNKQYLIDPTAGTGTAPITPYTPTGLQAVPVSGTPTVNASGASIVAFARAQIGKPYIYGGTGNPGWDCSGLVQAALKTVGVDVPHSALLQLTSTKGKIISASTKDVSKLLPGDIIFPAALPETLGNHVAIYSGNGNIIEAAYPGTNVRERAIYSFLTAKRFTNE